MPCGELPGRAVHPLQVNVVAVGSFPLAPQRRRLFTAHLLPCSRRVAAQDASDALVEDERARLGRVEQGGAGEVEECATRRPGPGRGWRCAGCGRRLPPLVRKDGNSPIQDGAVGAVAVGALSPEVAGDKGAGDVAA